MVYQGNLNYHGADTLQVVSTDTGSATDTDTVNITVNSVNDAPLGTDGAVTTNEDTPYTFAQSDFGFTDVDVPDSLSAVRIDTLPAAGTLTLSGSAVTAGQVILRPISPQATWSTRRRPTPTAQG